MLRYPSREQEDATSASFVGRVARFRRPSNASPLPYSPQLSKHTYLSPEDRRNGADAAWSDASISPYTSYPVSPAINYDRDLPQLPPDALADIDSNQLASRHLPRTDDEVRSRHFSQYGTTIGTIAPNSASESSAAFGRADNAKQSAAHRFASASTSAALSAGLGLKKLGKKASAARLRLINTAQQAQEREASYAALRGVGSSHQTDNDTASSLRSSNSNPGTPSDYDQAESPCPYGVDTFVDSADPSISLPYDVAHNVHVDIGPQGYTGLPASWAQILLSEGMDEHDVRQDPEAAARLVEERTEYFVQRAVESGGDAENIRRILSQKLAADANLSTAIASTQATQPNRRRGDSVHSIASTSYSSVLDLGHAYDFSSLHETQPVPRVSPLPNKSPLLPDFAAEDYDDWATSLLSSIPDDNLDQKAASQQKLAEPEAKDSRRRSGSLSQMVSGSSLNGLGIGIASDATPRRAIQRDRDLLVASNATPKASQRMRASIGLDPESLRGRTASLRQLRLFLPCPRLERRQTDSCRPPKMK